MRIYVVLYGCAAKPELVDEIKGFQLTQSDANSYCEKYNKEAEEGWAYYYEPADSLPLV